ncbi:MAG: hypothetical protein K5669_00235 [Lachnospiraceae bacterium]|nr:hypothetical protein [Lachnospiraceae bacterium]
MAGLEIAPIVRAQDYSFIKHNEDVKPEVDQSNLNVAREQKEVLQNKDVVNTNQSSWHSKDPDAREKGSNEYYGDGGQGRNKQNDKKKPVDKMVVKGPSHGFDLKI